MYVHTAFELMVYLLVGETHWPRLLYIEYRFGKIDDRFDGQESRKEKRKGVIIFVPTIRKREKKRKKTDFSKLYYYNIVFK